MANLKYISSFIIFGQTRGIKWTVPSHFLAKKKQLSFQEELRPIAASIKEGVLLLRSTIVLRGQDKVGRWLKISIFVHVQGKNVHVAEPLTVLSVYSLNLTNSGQFILELLYQFPFILIQFPTLNSFLSKNSVYYCKKYILATIGIGYNSKNWYLIYLNTIVICKTTIVRISGKTSKILLTRFSMVQNLLLITLNLRKRAILTLIIPIAQQKTQLHHSYTF